MVIEYRRAAAADGAAAAEVYIAARHDAVPAIPPMAHPDDDVRRYWREVLFAKADIWVAEASGGELVAVMALEADWVDQLYVRPGWNNGGLGSALLDIAKREQPDGLRLWAFQSNTGARRFYERHGFTEIDRTDGDNEEHAPDVLYRWTP